MKEVRIDANDTKENFDHLNLYYFLTNYNTCACFMYYYKYFIISFNVVILKNIEINDKSKKLKIIELS
ncbi:hypothetical protein Calag_0520 [Caldisphaera lagunensis DSM 15908]|uniref:Uncharacterized protein n=1 Tax=Caldisphaera lagunensis (strain DSM 15908 / JCM 11604 / ANMR 0165 / IC-154) TaxID=1056495 RepID=L0A8S9_CALLD|nr:hypothetical protein Calag_0520 [Caldisphaera lagunensis DSM 15908]